MGLEIFQVYLARFSMLNCEEQLENDLWDLRNRLV